MGTNKPQVLEKKRMRDGSCIKALFQYEVLSNRVVRKLWPCHKYTKCYVCEDFERMWFGFLLIKILEKRHPSVFKSPMS